MTKRMAWLLVVIGCGLVTAGLLVYLYWPAPTATATQPSNDRAAIKQLQAQVAELRQNMFQSSGALLSAARDLQQAQDSRPAPAQVAAADPEAKPPEPTDVEVRMKLEEQFKTQRVDMGWSNQASTLLNNHINQGIPAGSRLVSVQCKSTMCRVESKHENLAVYDKYINEALLFPQGGWNGPVMTQITNPGAEPVASVAYMLRDGEDFEKIAAQ